MPTDKEIRDLCRRVSLAQNDEDFRSRITELQTLIREHIADAANLGIHLILKAPRQNPTVEHTVAKKDGTED